MQINDWYAKTNEETFRDLDSQPAGLTLQEAGKRLEKHGPNEIQAAKRISAWQILLEQFKNILILILLGATILSLFLGHWV
ncbi:MAG: hypothetical protein FJ031_14655, partial [Chloroflexi bacterium]|nr:hypothetical protein [Chloroflexota bacterium]